MSEEKQEGSLLDYLKTKGKQFKAHLDSMKPPTERTVVHRSVLGEVGIEVVFEPSNLKAPFEFVVTTDGKTGVVLARFDNMNKASMFLDAFSKGWMIGTGKIEI